MTEIYIVRHGNTFDKGDTVTRVGARTDLPLSKSGLAQAENLAVHFSDRDIGSFGAAYCSALKRTRQTAEAILQRNPSDADLSVLEFLNEVDYGPDENRPEDEVIARIGQTALDLWDAEAIAPEGWLVDAHAIETAWIELFERLKQFPSERPVLIVTSNGVARFALSALGKSEMVESIKLKTGAYGLFLITDAGEVQIKSWNQRPSA